MGAARIVAQGRPDAPTDLRISVAARDSDMVMALAGELDLATTPALQACLDAGDLAGRDVVMDLSQLNFIDASGLRTLIDAYRAAVKRGHRLCVARTSPSLDRLLAITGTGGLLGLAGPVS